MAGLFTRLARPASVLVVGAGGGIGAEFVRQLPERLPGARLFAASRAHDGDATASITPLVLDVTVESSIAAACQQIAASTGRLDLVVNCAGVLHSDEALWPERRLADVDPDAVARAFQVNATGPLLLAKHIAPLLPSQDACVLATLSARVGSIGDNRLGGWYAYRASKAAQNMFTRCLSIELRRRARGVIVTALHPGTTDTALSRPFQRGVPEGKLFSAATSVTAMLNVVDALDTSDNGSFLAWDGSPIPW